MLPGSSVDTVPSDMHLSSVMLRGGCDIMQQDTLYRVLRLIDEQG